MKKLLIFTGIILSVVLMFQSCYKDNEADLYPYSGQCDSTAATYTAAIAPIMSANCNSCHSGAGASGGVITATYAGLSAVAANGKLWGCASHQSGFTAMPPGGSKLQACDLAKIKHWINSGYPNN